MRLNFCKRLQVEDEIFFVFMSALFAVAICQSLLPKLARSRSGSAVNTAYF